MQNSNDPKFTYNKVAKKYAEKFYNELDNKPLECKILDLFIERVPEKGVIYDLGCGPGEIADYMYKKRKKNIYALDISDKMIKEAKKLNPFINFQTGDMLDLDHINDSTVEGLVSFYSIIHFDLEGVKKSILEMYRILKKGAYLLLTFHNNLSGEYNKNIKVLHKDKFFDEDVNIDFYMFDPQDIVKIIEDVGFTITERITRYYYKNAGEGQSDRTILFAMKE